MDQFFSHNISESPSIHRDVLELFTRMDQCIRRFITEYDDLCRRVNENLSNKKTAGEKALQFMSQKYAEECQTIVREYERKNKACQDHILELMQRQATDIKQEETKFQKWEEDCTIQINERIRKNRRENEADKIYHEQAREIRNKVRAILGTKLYDKIVRDVNADPCTSEREARAILSDFDLSVQYQSEDNIYTIHNSLIRRFLFSEKRNTLCCSLEKTTKNLKVAVSFLEKWRQAQLAEEERKNEASKKKEHTLLEQRIIAIQKDYGEKTQEQKKTASLLKDKYDHLLEGKKNAHSMELAKTKRLVVKELSDEQVKWNNEKKKQVNAFAAMLESEFPVKKLMNAFSSLWKMAASFRTDSFGKQDMVSDEALQNVPVGVQMIDISGWYNSPEGGSIVRKLINSRYFFLLRQSVMNGKRIFEDRVLWFPRFFSLEYGENIITYSAERLQSTMETILEAMAMRLLWSIPVGQCQFLLGDAFKLSAFPYLSSLDPASFNSGGNTLYRSILMGDRVWSSVQEIKEQIRDSKKRYGTGGDLRRAKSLRLYNREHPMNPHTFLLSLLYKFPAGLNEEDLQSILMMCKDCGKWGYSSVFSCSKRELDNLESKTKSVMSQILKMSVCLSMENDGKTFRISRSPFAFEHGGFIEFYGLPDDQTMDVMKAVLRKKTDEKGVRKILFEKYPDICPETDKWFSQSSAKGMVVPVGYFENGEVCNIIFDYTRVHTIINGDTGSGKTNLLHVLITNTLLRYSPDEVEIYLIDFKHGTEFRRYTNYNLPNFRVISICNEPEFALQVLKDIQKEIGNRVTLFGNSSTGIEGYRQLHKSKLSRTILILDELSELVNVATVKNDKTIRSQIMNRLKEFAMQGRAYGIHMVISGQNLSEIPEIKDIKESCNTIIALRCNPDQVRKLINDEGVACMRLINARDKGACVIRLEKSIPPQVEHTAYLDPDHTHLELLDKIHKYYCVKKQFARPIILSTNAEANPTNVYMRYLECGDLTLVRPEVFWIGNTISTTPLSEIDLKGRNLWVAGGASGEAEEAGKSIAFFLLLSLLLQQKKEKNQIIYYNGIADRASMVGIEDRAGELSLAMPNHIFYRTAEQLNNALEAVYMTYSKRKQGGVENKLIWLVLYRPEHGLFQNIQLMQMLQEIMIDGSEVGIRTILMTTEPGRVAGLGLASIPIVDKLLLEMDSAMYQIVIGAKPVMEPRNQLALTSSNQRLCIYEIPSSSFVENIAYKLLE